MPLHGVRYRPHQCAPALTPGGPTAQHPPGTHCALGPHSAQRSRPAHSLGRPRSAQMLDATANRLKHIEDKVLALPALVKLSFRQNLLSDDEEVSRLQCAQGATRVALNAEHCGCGAAPAPGFINCPHLGMSSSHFLITFFLDLSSIDGAGSAR